jgi:NTE family protein/lysophospholipid hydrolase
MSSAHAPRALELLRGVDFFRGFAEERLLPVAESMEIVTLDAGQALIRQGEVGDAMFIVESGTLRAIVRRPNGVEREVGRIGPGQPVGEVQTLGGGRRMATVEAVTECCVYRLPRIAFEALHDELHSATGTFALVRNRLLGARLATTLPEILGHMDPAVVEEIASKAEMLFLKQGESPFHQGDECDGWYLVLGGRLRLIRRDEKSGAETAIEELGYGESMGEIAMITGERRGATPYAVRDSIVARFPVTSFEAIMVKHPQVLLSICRTLIRRLSHDERRAAPRQLVLAIVTTTPGSVVAGFGRALAEALGSVGKSLFVDAKFISDAGILANPSRLAANNPNWLNFAGWLEQQQQATPFIVLEGDSTPTGWAERAIGQADQVVVVADASADPKPGPVEAAFLSDDAHRVRRSRRTLILVHPEGTKLPNGTQAWLKARSVDAHFHVRAGNREDVARVARSLTGRAVGLALGGGGARGYAHLGVVKALRELGIPIDAIGGTSMGAIMAGQLTLGLTLEELFELNRRIIATSPFTEYTVPMVALLKTKRIEQSAKMAFGDARIEDLWLPYFAISSNLTTAEMVIHQEGPVWEAARASGSLPGIAVPVIKGNHLLVDGGVMNNVPGDVMREKCGGGPVIAVNVSPEEDVRIDQAEFPPQWRMFRRRFMPFMTPEKVPGISDILMRTTLLASASRTAQVQRSVDLYLRPPIDAFGMLDFERMEELVETGYRYTMEAASRWKLPVAVDALAKM